MKSRLVFLSLAVALVWPCVAVSFADESSAPGNATAAKNSAAVAGEAAAAANDAPIPPESSSPAPPADESTADAKPAAPTYLLRYKFQPNEVVRWQVVHEALVRTTVGGTTQTAETHSESVKVWQVKSVDAATGVATFVHSVEKVTMRQAVSGRQEVRYDSEKDAVVPAEFEHIAKSVGVPLSVVELDSRGHIVKRHEERAQPNGNPGEMTVPLPEQAVAVGDSWALPHDASVRQKDGSTKQVKTRQQFTFVGVENGIATIKVETIVLTPIRDPELEAQLIQHVTDGTVRFDIEAGRVAGQQTDIDKRVVGFQGETSSLHYLTRFTEVLMPKPTATASNEKAGAKPTATAKKSDTNVAAKPNAAAAKSNPPEDKSAARPAPKTVTGAPQAKPAQTKPPQKATVKQAPPQKAKTGNKPNPAQQKRR